MDTFMEQLLKFNNQSVGRDRIARLLQYLSRLLWYRLQIHNRECYVDGFKNLEYQLSTFRKLLRFGRCIDSLYQVFPSLQHEDAAIRCTSSISKICNGLYLLADHLLWLGRADVCDVSIDKWTKVSNTYWLYSIIMNLARDLYEILLLLRSQKEEILPVEGTKNATDVSKTVYRAVSVLQDNRIVMIDTIKNACDLFIPMTQLGYTDLSPGTVGILGVVSSLASMIVIVDPSLKLPHS